MDCWVCCDDYAINITGGFAATRRMLEMFRSRAINMNEGIVTASYIGAAILFILALGGLSKQRRLVEVICME